MRGVAPEFARMRFPTLPLSRLCSFALPIGLLSSVACAPANVEGAVDGEAVAALSSASFTEANLGDGEAARTVITTSAISVLDGCGVATRLQEKRNEAFAEMLDATDGETDSDAIDAAMLAYAEAQVDAVKAEVPATYWTATLQANAADEDDIQGASGELNADDIDLSEDVVMTLTLCRVNAHPEVDDSNGIPSVKNDQDCFAADGGDVQVETFVENQNIVAHATDVKLVDADGEDAGDVAVNISATHCPSLEKALQDFEEVAQ
jgi:hypothetical protein